MLSVKEQRREAPKRLLSDFDFDKLKRLLGKSNYDFDKVKRLICEFDSDFDFDFYTLDYDDFKLYLPVIDYLSEFREFITYLFSFRESIIPEKQDEFCNLLSHVQFVNLFSKSLSKGNCYITALRCLTPFVVADKQFDYFECLSDLEDCFICFVERVSYRERLRREFCAGLIGIDKVVNSFRCWMFKPFYYVLKSGIDDSSALVCRAPKRGDRKYANKVVRKFEGLSDKFSGSHVRCFNFGQRGGLVKSRLVSLVLEYNPHIVSLFDAWSRVGEDFNRFMSLIRRRFGRVASVRVWESHESGYPHIHVVLGFLDHEFAGRFHRDSKGDCRYVVVGDDFKMLESCWSHGFVRNRLVDSFDGGIRYLSKYLIKNVSFDNAVSGGEYSKGVKTLVLGWLFGKRSFAISDEALWSELLESFLSSDEIKCKLMRMSNSNKVSDFLVDNSLKSVTKGVLIKDKKEFEEFKKRNSPFLGVLKSNRVIWDDYCDHLVSKSRLIEFGNSDNGDSRFVLADDFDFMSVPVSSEFKCKSAISDLDDSNVNDEKVMSDFEKLRILKAEYD